MGITQKEEMRKGDQKCVEKSSLVEVSLQEMRIQEARIERKRRQNTIDLLLLLLHNKANSRLNSLNRNLRREVNTEDKIAPVNVSFIQKDAGCIPSRHRFFIESQISGQKSATLRYLSPVS